MLGSFPISGREAVVEKQLTYDEIGVSFALLLWKSVIETCSLGDDRLINIFRLFPLSGAAGRNKDSQQRLACKAVLPNKLIFALALLSLHSSQFSKIENSVTLSMVIVECCSPIATK